MSLATRPAGEEAGHLSVLMIGELRQGVEGLTRRDPPAARGRSIRYAA